MKEPESMSFAPTELASEFRLDDAHPFSEGLASVKVGNKWGYILTTAGS